MKKCLAIIVGLALASLIGLYGSGWTGPTEPPAGRASLDPSSSLDVLPYDDLLLWQDFDVADRLPPGVLGWVEADPGAIEAQVSSLRYTEGHTSATRLTRNLGVRPEVVEVTIDAGDDTSGLNIRYSSAGFYRIRWNKVTGRFEIDEVATGDTTSVTSLVSAAMPREDGQTAYDLVVTDTGRDIIARIRGYEVELRASDSPGFTNSFLKSTSLALYFGGRKPSGFRSIRVWRMAPDYDQTRHVAPMWGTFEKSRHSAVRHKGTHDRTYIAWITPWGSLYVRYFDHAAEAWSDLALIDHLAQRVGRWARDDHNYPTLVVAADGTICAFAAVHQGGGPAFYCWRSRAPEDIASFDSPYLFNRDHLTPPANAGYPTPFRVANGDLVLFYRGDGGSTSGNWFITRSSDNGATWSARTLFGDTEDSLYCFLEQNPANPDHLTCFAYLSQRGSPSRYNVYHLESLDGGVTWQGADGTLISLPATDINMDTVFLTEPDQCRVTGVAFRNGKGAALIAYKSDPDTEYRYCWWTGERWKTARVARTRTWWNGNGSSELPGGGDLHPLDPDEMVLAQPVEGVFELQRWRTRDGGLTWRKAADITSGSARDNVRPAFVKNPHGSLPFIWYYGEYRGNEGLNGAWDGYDDALVRAYRIDREMENASGDASGE